MNTQDPSPSINPGEGFRMLSEGDPIHSKVQGYYGEPGGWMRTGSEGAYYSAALVPMREPIAAATPSALPVPALDLADEIFKAHSKPDLSSPNHYDPVAEMYRYAKDLELERRSLREEVTKLKDEANTFNSALGSAKLLLAEAERKMEALRSRLSEAAKPSQDPKPQAGGDKPSVTDPLTWTKEKPKVWYKYRWADEPEKEYTIRVGGMGWEFTDPAHNKGRVIEFAGPIPEPRPLPQEGV